MDFSGTHSGSGPFLLASKGNRPALIQAHAWRLTSSAIRPKMQIREFIEKDTKAVIDLWVKCRLVVSWNNPQKDIERKLKVGRDLFLVGTSDNKIVLLLSEVSGRYWTRTSDLTDVNRAL